MGLRVLLAVLGVIVLATLPAAVRPASAQVAQPYRVVSDSYYRVDPASGTMAVRLEATFYNAQGAELKSVPLSLMPGATALSVTTRDGAQLKTTIAQANPALGMPGVATVQLSAPLKASARTDVVADYTVPAQSNALVHMSPGIVESPFVSQGVGSFVFVDVPKAASNYFDPGCVQLSSQPDEVSAAASVRWVCGEILRAVFGRTDSTESACAQADDRCRQRTLKGSVVAFAQSITDASSQGAVEADVPLASRTLHVTFRYFKRDEKWALRQMEVAKAAIPRLEALFGFPFPFESLSLRESHHIELTGVLGLAYNSGGDILVAPDTGFDDEVTVHEIAHEWAGANLAERWEAEGLAEYAVRTLAPDLGFTPTDRGWQRLPYTDRLSTWGEGSTVSNADYWYGKAGAFFQALEKAVGGQRVMTAILAGLDPRSPRAPFAGRDLMDRAEAASGANLDDLFFEWVFNPAAATDLLKQRRDAYNRLKPVVEHAASLGLSGMPADIQANLDAWAFAAVPAQVVQASKLLDAYAAVSRDAADAGLPASPAVPKSWASDSLAHTSGVIDDERLAIAAIVAAAGLLGDQLADPAAAAQLENARQKFADGDLAAAKRLASESTSTQFNGTAAAKIIELAKAKQSAYSPTFFSRIGLLFLEPESDLAGAQKAYDAGDYRNALSLSRSAYDAWNDAESRGIQRLASLAAVLCAISVAAWYLLRRTEDSPQNRIRRQGHFIESSQIAWRDWENQ